MEKDNSNSNLKSSLQIKREELNAEIQKFAKELSGGCNKIEDRKRQEELALCILKTYIKSPVILNGSKICTEKFFKLIYGEKYDIYINGFNFQKYRSDDEQLRSIIKEYINVSLNYINEQISGYVFYIKELQLECFWDLQDEKGLKCLLYIDVK